MHVEVNEQNIALYELAKMTGNSREDLLSRAAEAREAGVVLYCQIPDDLVKVNAFERFDSEPAPKLGVSDQVNTYSDRCRYEMKWTDEVGEIPVCIIHGQNSRHEEESRKPGSQVPCLEMDPYPEEE